MTVGHATSRDVKTKNNAHPFRSWRLAAKMDVETVVRLARVFDENLSVTPNYVLVIETGRRRPSYELAKALSRVTNEAVTVEQFMEFEGLIPRTRAA